MTPSVPFKLAHGFAAVLALCLLMSGIVARGADFPQPVEGDFVVHDFRFRTGAIFPQLRIHYRTLGRPRTDANGLVTNAVLILHGTTGSGKQFFVKEFAGELFNPGQLLDAQKYYLIFPDDIGHGKSAKPSDGLRANFPEYRYADMVEAEHRLLVEGLRVSHLRLVIGTSMGGMHTWLWGEMYPRFMDALMPLASLPAPIGGRNRMWRRMISEMIRTDPQWQAGNYTSEPHSLRLAAEMLYFMSGNPANRYRQAPSAQSADKILDASADGAMKTLDANDVLYAVESSTDYDPTNMLGNIEAPLIAVNSADDLINPPDLQLLETNIRLVKNGKAVVIPESDNTDGHGTCMMAAVWKEYLEELLGESQK
jgi:homoserine O-acetyltransferase/O-succinyltransferase